MKKLRKIVCLGDSLTYGYPFGPSFSWVAYAAQATGLNLINAGINGETLEDMEIRFENSIKKLKPSMLVILGGTNDAFCREISIAETVFHLSNILNKAESEAIEAVIGLSPPVDDSFAGPKLERITANYISLARNTNLLIIDFSAPFWYNENKIRAELYLDGVHPNEQGYYLMGEVAGKFFNNLISQASAKDYNDQNS